MPSNLEPSDAKSLATVQASVMRRGVQKNHIVEMVDFELIPFRKATVAGDKPFVCCERGVDALSCNWAIPLYLKQLSDDGLAMQVDFCHKSD